MKVHAQPRPPGVLFLHLSDIHFSRSRNDVVYDEDQDVRHELERDLERHRGLWGDVDAVLVSGDIAFSGKQEQYDRAYYWLQHLCCITGCDQQDVWVIPGNHDIDRKAYEDAIVSAVHQQLREATPAEFDKLTEKFLKTEQASAALYGAQKHFLELAEKFNCPPHPGKLYWDQDFLLNDGSKLRVRGLNSAVVCDSRDDDEVNRLVLGSVQCLAPRDDGIAYLFMSHHPPEWLKDRDDTEDRFRNRARIQLLGHKHRQRMGAMYDNLRLAAGAVNPDNREPDWLPRYNLLRVWVDGADDRRTLRVDVFARVWDKADEKFVADYDKETGEEQHEFTLPLPRWKAPAQARLSVEDVVVSASVGELIAVDAKKSVGGHATVTTDFPVNLHRKLVYRFLSLPHHVRIEIATSLKLLRDEDEGVDDAELFRRILSRAKENNQLNQLITNVDRRYTGQ